MSEHLQLPANPTLGKRRSEDDLGKEDADRSVFITNEHLIFSPPKYTWTLADMGLNDDVATTPFAVSGDFPLFSAATIRKMRGELLTDEVQQKFQKSGSIVNRQLRGMVPKCVQHPKQRNKTNGVIY
jgi:hypothetical protein